MHVNRAESERHDLVSPEVSIDEDLAVAADLDTVALAKNRLPLTRQNE
jgi:hypothetical protein